MLMIFEENEVLAVLTFHAFFFALARPREKAVFYWPDALRSSKGGGKLAVVWTGKVIAGTHLAINGIGGSEAAYESAFQAADRVG